jgi:hypothetical protein
VRHGARLALAGALAPLTLTGCLGVKTTQDKSAERAARAETRLANQKGLAVTRENADVKVELSRVLQDANGVAAIVRLKNDGPAQIGVPVAITVQDAKGTKLFANDAPGLDPALVSMPALRHGETTYWVNNQILVAGKADKLAVKVGAARGQAPADLPKITIADLRLDHDEDGAFARGTVRNESAVEQRRLTIFCVVGAGRTVEAAGRAVVDKLPAAAAAKKPTRFTVYFIGKPKRAELSCSAPPTVLAGGQAK